MVGKLRNPALAAVCLATLAAVLATSTPAAAQGTAGIRISGAAKNKPFIVLMPGSGGAIPSHWAGVASAQGFAVVSVDVASIFSGRSLLNVSEQEQVQTVGTALQAAQQAGLDMQRWAILGLSKGGTVALLSAGASRPAGTAQPSAVFAFYPGSVGWCPNSHGASTRVHIFYGDADGWGTHRGTRDACRRQAGGNVAYHEYPGVHHGFDRGGAARTVTCCGTSWVDQGNPAATAKARGVVAATLRSVRR
ncbi:MAG TPA: hypothetical protein PK812_01045 [Beijerinckiaceae bacterium]|nr:hypothetical protein [Beijerinckiaceae bacterium]